MICMLRRNALRSAPRLPYTSSPSKNTEPPVAGIKRRILRPTVVLPQPDSPTSPKVSPSRMLKLTPSTALTQAATRCSKPERTGKYFFRSCTTRRSFLLSSILIAISGLLLGRGRDQHLVAQEVPVGAFH